MLNTIASIQYNQFTFTNFKDQAGKLAKKSLAVGLAAVSGVLVCSEFDLLLRKKPSLIKIHDTLLNPISQDSQQSINQYNQQVNLNKLAELLKENCKNGINTKINIDPKHLFSSASSEKVLLDHIEKQIEKPGLFNIEQQSFINSALIPGVSEEVLFRGLLQDVFLKRAVHKLVSKISPRHANFIDSKIYTAARILISASVFSLYHAMDINGSLINNPLDHIPLTFIKGIVYGLLKENVGLSAAIGAHVLNNTLDILPELIVNK